MTKQFFYDFFHKEVLTADYAKKIGADFYARDAKESVDVARQVIG